MNYGLVAGINRNIQFDTNRKLLGLQEHGFASNWTAISYENLAYYHLFDSDYVITAIAIKPTTSTIALGRVGTHGGQYTGDILQSGTATIEYALYSSDANDIHGIPSYGLVTYNANQEVVFNSDIHYLKIVDIIDVNRSRLLNWESVTIEHDVENPFYIIPNNQAHTPYMGWPWSRFLSLGIQKINATSAKISWFPFIAHPNAPTSTERFAVPTPFRIAICVL